MGYRYSTCSGTNRYASRRCITRNCATNCLTNNWSNYGSCNANCGYGTIRRRRYVRRYPSGGGRSCPNLWGNALCYSRNRCAVNCGYNNWGNWGSCNANCYSSGYRYRRRYIYRKPSGGGRACPSTLQSIRCTACCRRNCVLNSWGNYGSCSSSCGAGRQTRYRYVARYQSCGGYACSNSRTSTRYCVQYTSRSCQVNNWGSWGSCGYSSGSCGSGYRYRRRYVRVNQYCRGANCPNVNQAQSCSRCCPKSCVWTSYNSWTGCTASCGSGYQYRYRRVSTSASCGGGCPGSGTDTKSCSNYVKRDCVLGKWGLYTPCTNPCGSGTQTRTRPVISQATCGGSCGSTSQTIGCTAYINKDCTVSSWGNFGVCDSKCSVGKVHRYRKITSPAVCRGSCPYSLSDSKSCGLVNGGCDQRCNNGVCSCNAGYYLTGTTTCQAKSCSAPTITSYCPSGKLCKKPSPSCTSSKYLYSSTCTLKCPQGYSLKGSPSVIICLASTVWTDHSTAYCELDNKPPTAISISRTYVNENSPSGTVVGSFTTADPNPSDSHSYSLTDSAGGKFRISGSTLYTLFVPNYETQAHSYSIKVKSTDTGGFFLVKTFTINIRDINEKPTACKLSSTTVRENPYLDTTVGTLSTSDPDASQSFTYSLLSSASGRFKLIGNTVKIALANTRCLAEGGGKCVINYESSSLNKFSITVRTTDNGSPSQYYDCKLTIDATNVNDQPRNLQLNGYTIKEGSAIGTQVGSLSSSDEDVSQSTTYSLVDDDGGRFKISQNKFIVAAKVANFETQTSHHITVRATDNGSPALYVQKAFTVTVLDVKEAPVAIQVTSAGAQLTFGTNNPTVNENSVRNTVVGTVVASDPDHNAVITFSLDDNAGGRFKLDSPGNVQCKTASKADPTAETVCSVRVLVAGILNHEVDALHTIIVRATDNHGLFKVQKFSVKIVDMNDAPHDITSVGGAPHVKENLNNLVITSFLSSDEDASHKHTYTITSDPDKKFKIVGSRLMTTASANLNYEAKSTYSVVVRTTDNGSPAQYYEKTFTVTVVDVNEVPTSVSLSASDVFENSAPDTAIGTFSTIDPDNYASKRQTFKYSLGDSAQGRFQLSGTSLQVKAPNAECLKYGGLYCKLNYEAAKTHTIIVHVTDSGSPPLSKDFKLTVNVKNINDKPRHIDVSNTIVKENEPAGTKVGTVSFKDEDIGQKHTVTMTDTDNGQFKLSADSLSVLKAKPTDYETKKAHKITIKVTDNGSPPMSISKDIFISVTDVNEAPINSIFTSTNGQLTFADDHARINENSKIGTIIGTIVARDHDANQQLTFSLDDNADNLFAVAPTSTCDFTSGSLCSAPLTVFGSLDHEDTDQEYIVVRVSDPHGKFKVTKFFITIVDVNDAPNNMTITSAQVSENQAGAFVGAFLTDDDDPRQTFNYTLVNDANGRFALFVDDLRTVGALNYESTPTLTIRVRTTDSGTPPLSYEKDFVISVIDVNEIPTSLHISGNHIDENSPSNTAIGALSTLDPDNTGKVPWQTFSYALLGTAGGRFKIDAGVLKVRSSNVACLALGGTACWLNYEHQPVYTVLVRTTDSGSPPLFADFTINITLRDINDRPRKLQLSDYRVHENQPVGTVIGMLSGFDEDAKQHLSYVLSNDNGGKFKIVGNELQKAMPANYEIFKSHYITVVMKDDGTPSLNISQTYLIEVLDVNEAPVTTNITDTDGQLTFTTDIPEVEENSAVGTVVGTIVAVDPDYNQTLTFKLDDDATGLFSLSSSVSCQKVTDIHGHHSSCQTKLLVAGALNYESVKTHDVVVRVTDQSGHFNVQRFTVKVVDANDVPHDIQILARTIDENSQMVFITDFVTLDEDKTHTHTYSLASNPSNQFAIVNNSLYTSATATLNYEKQQQWTISILSTDDGVPPLSIKEQFVIDVMDVNEVISSINITLDKIDENSPVNTVIGELRTIDPDNFGPKGVWQNATCMASDNADGIFTVYANILKVAQASIDYEQNKSFTVTVQCTDDGQPPLTQSWTFTVHVINVNEAPTSISISKNDIDENEPTDSVVGVFSTVDPDNKNSITQTFTYSFVHPLPGLPFTIVGNQLLTARPLDFEKTAVWPVVVQSKDSGGLSAIHVFQVNVNDINEPPTGFLLIAAGDVAENSPAGSYVGDVLAVDEDANQSHTFVVLGAAPGTQLNSSSIDPSLSDAFEINQTNGVLSTGNYTWNYEITPNYTVWIQTSDHGLLPSLRYTDVLVVHISDINEAPTNITLDNDKVAENSPIGTVVGNLAVTDPDNYGVHAGSQGFNCLVLDAFAHSFKVVNHTVLVVSKDNLDYENEVSHDIEIQCWDDDKVNPLFMNKQFTINLTNVNEAPIKLAMSNSTIDENLGPHAELGIVTAIDPDNEVEQLQNLTFNLLQENTTDVPFVLVDGYIIEATTDLDYETRDLYTLTVGATDTGVPALTTQAEFNISVINENDPPTEVVLNSTGILENSPLGTVIGTLSTVDSDIGQTYTYSVQEIVNISDDSMFGIRGNQLILLTSVDYETEDVWQVLIQTTDNGQPALSHQNIVYVKILDVNEAPSEIQIDFNTTFDEHPAPGTVVANFTVIDEDLNQTHTCRLMTGQDSFVILNATISGEGEIILEVYNSSALDYEADPIVYVTINCTDDGEPPLSIAKTIAFNLKDVNEQPTGVALSGNHTVPENSLPGYVVGQLSTIDPDKGQIYTYALFGNGSDSFLINEGLSRLEVESSGWLNYEAVTNPYLEIVIETSDNGSPPLAFNQTINITIIDINEPPSAIRLIHISNLREDAPDGTIIGQLVCTNPELNQTVSYTINETSHQDGGPEFGTFTNATGTYIQMKSRGNFTEYQDNFVFEVNATDSGWPAEWTLGTVEFNLTLLDPCSTGELLCGNGSDCVRVNTSAGYCECQSGFLLDPYLLSCVEVDDCFYNPQVVNFSPDELSTVVTTVAVGATPMPNSTMQPICRNNATCTDLTDGYNCTCLPGFTGFECDSRIDRCLTQSSNCMNGASCVDSPSQMACVCAAGYTGITCASDVDECATAKCGAGQCIDAINAYSCQCPESYTGQNCEYLTSACAVDSCGQGDCVPLKADVSAPTSGDGTSSIIVSGGDTEHPAEGPSYVCVPVSSAVHDHFENGSLTADDLKAWKELILGTPLPSGDGEFDYADDVYILDGTGGGEVILAVILNGEPVNPVLVNVALSGSCRNTSELPPEVVALCGRWKDISPVSAQPIVLTTSSPEAQRSSSKTSTPLVWGVAAGLIAALLLISILVTCRVYTAKRKQRNELHRERLRTDPFMNDRAADEHAAEFMYDSPTQGGETFVPNPLYHDPKIGIYGESGREEVFSPVYAGGSTDGGLNEDTYARIEQDSAAGLGVSNPIYNMARADNDAEPLYDSPRDALAPKSNDGTAQKSDAFQIDHRADPFSVNADGNEYDDLQRLVDDIQWGDE
ncbi:cadherin-23-like [Sycon ciliatum]|uniref:cadherin-23-like n=1 Tax=Sycon ciliatum TaxID=27933 RepID=UPI0031F70B89